MSKPNIKLPINTATGKSIVSSTGETYSSNAIADARPNKDIKTFVGTEFYEAVAQRSTIDMELFIKDIPLEDQLDVFSIARELKKFRGTTTKPCIYTTPPDKILLCAYYTDSPFTLSSKKGIQIDPSTADSVWKYVVVSAPEDAVAKIGDIVEVVGSNAHVVVTTDLLERTLIVNVLSKFSNRDLESFLAGFNRLTLRRFVSINKFDILAIRNDI